MEIEFYQSFAPPQHHAQVQKIEQKYTVCNPRRQFVVGGLLLCYFNLELTRATAFMIFHIN